MALRLTEKSDIKIFILYLLTQLERPLDYVTLHDICVQDEFVNQFDFVEEFYELLDMNTGKCRMCVAGPVGKRPDPDATVRVATKFKNIARGYYGGLGRDIDIIHLNGSIEIAPLLDLSDVIVDIVETGATLKENNLEVIETIIPISARLISNKASFKFKTAEIEHLAEQMRIQIKTDD